MHTNTQKASHGPEACSASVSIGRPQRESGAPDDHRYKPNSQSNCHDTSIGSQIQIVVVRLFHFEPTRTSLILGNCQEISSEANTSPRVLFDKPKGGTPDLFSRCPVSGVLT